MILDALYAFMIERILVRTSSFLENGEIVEVFATYDFVVGEPTVAKLTKLTPL